MRRPFPHSATRIERGCIVSTRSGLGIVVRRRGNRVVLVRIIKGPMPHHRADIHPSWLGTLQMGLKQGDVVRCVPSVMDVYPLHPMQTTAPTTLMQRIDKAVTRELAIRQDEDASRQRPGGPAIPHHRYG